MTVTSKKEEVDLTFKITMGEDFTLKVGSHTYQVRFLPRKTVGEDIYGCFENEEIWIRNDIPVSLQLSTLFHELLHAMEVLYEVKMSHKDLNLVSDLYSQILLENFKVNAEDQGKS